MFMKNFFIYPNTRKDGALALLPQVCGQLRREGVRLMLPMQLRAAALDIQGADYMETDAAIQFANAAIVLGGDGTMLRIARTAARYNVPLLGVNVGHVGFMTELEPGELGEMEKLFTGEYSTDSRMMLHVSVIRDQRVVYENDALNDIVLAKGTAFRVVCVCISADDEEVTQFNGDGLIVATPTGSTAYSLSAGGPIISPSCRAVVLTPMSPHNLTMRPIVMSDGSVISLRIRTRGNTASISIDNRTMKIPDGASFVIKLAERVISLAVPHNISFYGTLRDKMMWGIDVR